ncbi:MAG: sulfatase-like hydrolase/transferase [Acidobacteria bacterium]|nr:sulfatase-like hydrolase/transferase [Acidobacteriota bacterium]
MRLLALFAGLLAYSSASVAAERPNFIVLFADDQGWGDLGVQGHPDIRTPNIDALAREGMRLTSFYAAPFCGPSRAALMTGTYPPRNSLDFNHGPKSTTGIHPHEVTVAELLQRQGYATMMIGKWHLGSKPQFLPHRNGFDHWFGLPYSNDMWPYHPLMPPQPDEDERMRAARKRADYTGYAGQGRYYDLAKGQGFPEPLPLMADDETLELNPDLTQLTKRYTDRALAFLEASKDRSFFLYLPYAMPHVPLFVSQERAGKSIRGLYGDAVEEVDWSVGRIRDKLIELGLDDDTLIVYTSDNGPWLQYGVDGGSAGPLRDGKGTLYEGGVRVPGIFHWPGHIPAGRVSSEPVATMDILPTFAALAGVAAPADRTLDGRDLWPLLSGRPGAASPHEYFYYFGGRGADHGTANLRAIRQGRWKLHVRRVGADGGFQPTELYDLHEDVSEKFNRLKLFPEIARRLLEQGERFAREIDAHRRPLGES